MFLQAIFWHTLCFRWLLSCVEFPLYVQYTSPGVKCLSKWNSAKSLVTWTDPVQSCFPSAKPLPSVCQKTSSFLLFWRKSYYLSVKNSPLSAVAEEVSLPTFLSLHPLPKLQWYASGFESSGILKTCLCHEGKAVLQLFWPSWLWKLYVLITYQAARRQLGADELLGDRINTGVCGCSPCSAF